MCAYDSNGNWYFDENDEYDRQAFAEEVEREKMRDIVKQQKKIASDQNALNQGWEEALESEGLDQATYLKLYNEDPEAVHQLMREGMAHLARGVKKSRDPKTGRFVKQPQPGHREAAPGPQRSEEAQQRIADLKAKVAKGENLTSSDEESVIDDIIGKLF